jgi:ATP adenylyltransferase
MNRLWAPWRSQYVEAAGKQAAALGDEACFLCSYWGDAAADQAHHVLCRWTHWYAVLNAYPYTNGHLMLVLGRHHEGFVGLHPEESQELGAGLELCESVIRSVYAPDGMNIGVNMGRAAGAGAIGHLHVHLLPRWSGDTNFMTSVGDTRVVPEALDRSYQRLSEALTQRRAS